LVWSDNGNTRTFNIKGCWDRDQRRRTLEIDAVEVVS
jgi:head-tail adaptor